MFWYSKQKRQWRKMYRIINEVKICLQKYKLEEICFKTKKKLKICIYMQNTISKLALLNHERYMVRTLLYL